VQKSRKIWLVVGVALLVLAVVAAASQYYRVEPRLRAEMIRTIERNFDGTAEIAELRLSGFPVLTVTGKNLVLRRHDTAQLPPLISIEEFEATAGILGILRSPRRIERVSLKGLKINVPPERDKDRKSDRPGKLRGNGLRNAAFVIGTVEADGTQLRILPKKTGKQPLVFQLYKLKLKAAGTGQPMTYDAVLTNATPPGLIDTQGEFGPWDTDDPGNTRVTGHYVFNNADLSVFKGLSGTLSSEGDFAGVLRRLEADGTTDTPDFSIKRAGHLVHLRTSFHAIIDGTSGDTLLQPVTARFGKSEVVCRGGVYEKEGTRGKSVVLDVEMDRARIEDVLKFAVRSRPPMVGSVALRVKMEIPSGDQEIVQKLRLQGSFQLAHSQFVDPQTQDKIVSLSLKSRGEHDDENDERIVSDLRGQFLLEDGTASFSGLSFSVPGAQIHLDGHYALVSEDLDFRGKLLMQEKLSNTQTGIKSALLKVLDPFFKGKKAGTELPIKITGTREAPKFGLNW
jgi:hypothetical protein